MYSLFLFLAVVILGVQLANIKQSHRELEKKFRILKDQFDRLYDTVETLKTKKGTVPRDTAAPDARAVGSPEAFESSPELDYDFAPVQKVTKTDPPPVKPDQKTVPYIPPAASPTPESHHSVPQSPGVDLRRRINQLNINWELFTGARLFAWVGGVAAFICIGLLLKHSIENNWIPPAARLASGAMLGAGLILASEKFKAVRLRILRHSLTATGIGVLYIVIFTATLYYDYLPAMAGFAMLVLVSGAAFVLAVYQKGLTVSVLGAIGAYATPLTQVFDDKL